MKKLQTRIPISGIDKNTTIALTNIQKTLDDIYRQLEDIYNNNSNTKTIDNYGIDKDNISDGNVAYYDKTNKKIKSSDKFAWNSVSNVLTVSNITSNVITATNVISNLISTNNLVSNIFTVTNIFTNVLFTGNVISNSLASFTNVNCNGNVILSTLTASMPIFTDANKKLVSNTMTGSGSVVMNVSPIIITPVIANLTASIIHPASDSTTALKITQANSTTVIMDIDTSNNRVGLGLTNPAAMLHILSPITMGTGGSALNGGTIRVYSSETAGVDIGGSIILGGNSGKAVTPYAFGAIRGGPDSASGTDYSANMQFHLIGSNGASSEYMRITTIGVGIGTTDFDGTPAIGKLIVKGTTTDGSTNIFVGRDSAEANVITIDTDGVITPGGYKSSDGSAGITCTITTAKITPVSGSNGSMTFKNGILTAQTQAT